MLAASAAAPLALAQQPKPPAGKAPASAPTAPPAPGSAAPAATHASAIAHVAAEIARGLGQVPAGALVAASPVTSDVPAPKSDELAVRVASQIAGRIGVAHAHPQPATLATARGVSGRAASLVYVQIEIAKGELRVTADLYPVVANGWERLRNPAPGPKAHAYAGARIDAEVRTFLQPIVLEQAAVHKAKHEENDVLAVGCGDVDADGGLELVLASRARVVVGKLRAGKLQVVKATPWSQLASRVPVPMREPIGSVLVAPRSHRDEILLGTTDRGAVAVDASLMTRRQLAGLPIPGADGDACASPSPELSAFEGPGVACAVAPPTAASTAAGPKAEPEPVLQVPVSRYDTIAALDLVGKDGAITQIVGAREPTGKLRLRRSDASGKAQEVPIDSVGAQLAIADLDLDGTPEIAVSADVADEPAAGAKRGPNETRDALVVWSWRPNGLVQRLKYPTKEAVRAIAACPPEERGVPGLVAVVGSEVWLVR